MVKWFSRLITVLIVLTITLSLSLPTSQVKGMPLAGATVTPNVTWDDFDTGAPDGSCSLREAIYSVIHNENYGGCTHTGAWDKDIVSLLPVTYSLSIAGTGPEDTGAAGDLDLYPPGAAAPHAVLSLSPTADLPDITIQGDPAGTTIDANNVDRVFEIHTGISVKLNWLTIKDGYSYDEPGDSGGAGVYNKWGVLAITNSIIEDNITPLGGSGGGVRNIGTLTILHSIIQTNTTLSSNSVTQTGSGGGVSNSGTLIMTDIAIIGNSTGDNTGTGSVGPGAGIFNTGDIMMTRVTVANNECGATNAQNGARGGGIYNDGEIDILTSTISFNFAGAAGLGGGNYDGGSGGGLYADSGSITSIEDSTIVRNHAGGSNGTGSADAGGIDIAGTVTMGNSILANNIADNDVDCDGTLTSDGFNLVENTTGCTITGTADTITGEDPLLGSLVDLGVEGWIHPLMPGSPVIDAGPATCRSTDQRIVSRPIDGDRDGTGTCDIGAFEARLIDFLPYFNSSLLPAIFKP